MEMVRECLPTNPITDIKTLNGTEVGSPHLRIMVYF